MNKEEYSSITLRPYQLLCTVCSLGEEKLEPNKVFEAIRKNPDVPITLRCNAGDVYVYQDAGIEEDTSEGSEYNRKRDLDILQRLDMAPGDTLPARTLFFRLLKMIPTVSEICGYDAVTSDAWKGCPKAKSGYYEEGHQKGINAIIPCRDEDEMVKEKKISVEEMYRANELAIRPHILMCLVCIIGGSGNINMEPLKADNLIEFLDIIRNNPDTSVTLVKGADWMICAPCPYRAIELNACVNVNGSGGLSNELRDLNLLQKLGLTYGTTMKAKELYKLIFERIPTTVEICTKINPSHSVWWDGCSAIESGNESYKRGREILITHYTSLIS